MKSQLNTRDAQRLHKMVADYADALRGAESCARIAAEHRAVSLLSDMNPFPNAIRAKTYAEMADGASREAKRRSKKALRTQLAIYKLIERLSTPKEA